MPTFSPDRDGPVMSVTAPASAAVDSEKLKMGPVVGMKGHRAGAPDWVGAARRC